MICYRDRTFCSFCDTCRHGAECPLALTSEVESAASDFGLPIAQYLGKPGCYEEVVKP